MKGIRWTAIFLVTMFLLALPTVTFAGKNDLVNMNVVNGNVRDVLVSLSQLGRVNMVIDENVQGKITIRLRNVPFADALETVVQSKNLVYANIGNVMMIRSMDGKDNKVPDSFKKIYAIPLHNLRAVDVKQSIEDSKLYDNVKVDEFTNSIILKGTGSEYNTLKQMINSIDIPSQQVKIEAKIVSINKTAAKNLGLEWNWETFPQTVEYTPGSGPTYDAAGNMTSAGTPATVKRNANRAWIAVTGTPETSATSPYYEFQYYVKLNALFTKGDAKLLARPNVIATNNLQAEILIGDKVPYPVKDKDGNITIQYQEAGIKLNYTPHITPDNRITAKIHTEVSVPTLVSEVQAYRISSRQADTVVTMKDGETMVIGGLINSNDSETLSRTPFLSDIPILGGLFKNKQTSTDGTELVIFLTAHIVKDKPDADANMNPDSAKVETKKSDTKNELAAAKKTTDLLGGELRD